MLRPWPWPCAEVGVQPWGHAYCRCGRGCFWTLGQLGVPQRTVCVSLDRSGPLFFSLIRVASEFPGCGSRWPERHFSGPCCSRPVTPDAGGLIEIPTGRSPAQPLPGFRRRGAPGAGGPPLRLQGGVPGSRVPRVTAVARGRRRPEPVRGHLPPPPCKMAAAARPT